MLTYDYKVIRSAPEKISIEARRRTCSTGPVIGVLIIKIQLDTWYWVHKANVYPSDSHPVQRRVLPWRIWFTG
jgi:hypothetical protein